MTRDFTTEDVEAHGGEREAFLAPVRDGGLRGRGPSRRVFNRPPARTESNSYHIRCVSGSEVDAGRAPPAYGRQRPAKVVPAMMIRQAKTIT